MTETGAIDRPLRVAVIGSGPAGFFAAEALLKLDEPRVAVDVLERLPTPYGLVRGGVAPDHQKIKRVARRYDKTARGSRFRFLGNVTFGTDVRLEDLRAHYDQVVYAVGNEANRRLNIAGEGLVRCTPAAVLVGWYNGHPDYRAAPIDLSVERVAVIGNGNVAIDVARMLVRSRAELERTDVSDHALEVLGSSAVRDVFVIGRRGPVQAAFTPAELAEIDAMEGVQMVVAAAELELDSASLAQLEQAPAKVRRNFELLQRCSQRPREPGLRTVRLCFLRSPVEIVGDPQGRVRGVRLGINELSLSTADGALRPRLTGRHEVLDVGMVVPAVGFVGTPLPDVPFDERHGRIANDDGRVVELDGTPRPNEYVVGWARSGPRGLIGAHKAASAQVVSHMVADLASGRVPARTLPEPDAIDRLLDSRGVRRVSFGDWQALDRIEVARGVRRGAPRSKLTDVGEMLAALDGRPSA